MPNTHWGAFTGTTRRELVTLIREHLAMLDIAESRVRDVPVKRLWAFIKAHGSSTAHFSIDIGNGELLEFHGLTEAEFAEQVAANDGLNAGSGRF
jgi:hypothetical protein